MKLLMLKGLPGSGKSTYAKQLVEKHNYVRVNKDDLRALFHNGKHSNAKEGFIMEMRDEAVRALLTRKLNVVVDDTNFAPKHAQTLSMIATEHNATFEELLIDTPLDECIKNDLKRPNPVGEGVIRDMYDRYLRVIETPKPGKGNVILVDIDGTLAHTTNRSPYDESLVKDDSVDEVVRSVVGAVQIEYYPDVKTIIMSGRHESCREDTEAWLSKHGIAYDQLLMRRNKLPDEKIELKDYIIKSRLYEEHINGKYNVICVFDDRDRVVEMWRDKGLKVFQVGEGRF